METNELQQIFITYLSDEDGDTWKDSESGELYLDYFHINSNAKKLSELAINHFILELETLILNKQDDLDRGKGIVILNEFIKQLKENGI